MKYLKEFINYFPVIAIKGLAAWLIIGLILSFFKIDILGETTMYSHTKEYIIAVLGAGTVIHFFQKFLFRSK